MGILTKKEMKALTDPETRDKRSASTGVIKLKIYQKKLTDAKHISLVNGFIPIAESLANRAVREMDSGGDPKQVFDRAFHAEMNRLTRDVGLRT